MKKSIAPLSKWSLNKPILFYFWNIKKLCYCLKPFLESDIVAYIWNNVLVFILFLSLLDEAKLIQLLYSDK